jgi:hypothetical protein
MPAKKAAAKPMKKGYHRMPDGSMMKDSEHKNGYGKNGKPSIVIAISMGKPKKATPKKGKTRGR